MFCSGYGALELAGGEAALDQEVVGAGVHGLDVELELGLAGEEDDRDLAAEAPDLVDELDAGARAEAIVEQAHVGGGGDQGVHGVLIVLHPADPVLVGRDLADQVAGEDVVILVVVDQQDIDRGVHVIPTRSRRSRTSRPRARA